MSLKLDSKQHPIEMKFGMRVRQSVRSQKN